jgi:WD40-like Beta Propeller Repeat
MALPGDGKRVAFLAGSDGGRNRVVVLGDEVITAGDWTVSWPLAITEGGTMACQLTDPSGRCCVAVDGCRGETFDSVGPPVLSEDGGTVAYRAQSGNAHFVVVATNKARAFDFVKDPSLSPDGRCVAYAAASGGQWFLVVDDEVRPVDREPVCVFVGPDRSFVGWSCLEPEAGGGSSARVVVGDRAGERFDLVGRPTFSPDGATFAYFAERGHHAYIVIGDQAVEVEGRPSDPVFSADGRRVAFGKRVDRQLWWTVLERP